MHTRRQLEKKFDKVLFTKKNISLLDRVLTAAKSAGFHQLGPCQNNSLFFSTADRTLLNW